jgi:hypothetical protein
MVEYDECIRPSIVADGGRMNLGTILLIVLVLALIGAVPAWPYSTGWGYYPAGGLGLLVLIVLILLISGRL